MTATTDAYYILVGYIMLATNVDLLSIFTTATSHFQKHTMTGTVQGEGPKKNNKFSKIISRTGKYFHKVRVVG